MKKAIKSPKIIGLFCIFFLIGYVILNKNFQLKHPLLSWGIVYCTLPVYLFFIIKHKLGKIKAPVKRNIQKPPPQNYNYDDYDNFDNFQVQKVDRLEKKTTTTNTTTTVTTETIYFKGNGYEE